MEILDSQDYTEKLCLEKKKKNSAKEVLLKHKMGKDFCKLGIQWDL